MHIAHGVFACSGWLARAFRCCGLSLGNSALLSEAWDSTNSFKFLSHLLSPDGRFLSPDDLGKLFSCQGSRNSFSIASQMQTLALRLGIYLFPPTWSAHPFGHSLSLNLGFSLHTLHLLWQKR